MIVCSCRQIKRHYHINTGCKSFATCYVAAGSPKTSELVLIRPIHVQRFHPSALPNEDVTMPMRVQIRRQAVRQKQQMQWSKAGAHLLLQTRRFCQLSGQKHKM
jgi:hypothetical protein